MDPDPEQLKKKLDELDYLFGEAEDAAAAAERAYDRIMKSVTDTAMLIYPELKEMEPDQIRQFGDRLSRHVYDIVDELDRISMWVEQPEKFDAEGNLLHGTEE